MRHQIWQAISEGLRNAMRFSGQMGLIPFWLWIGFLHVLGKLNTSFTGFYLAAYQSSSVDKNSLRAWLDAHPWASDWVQIAFTTLQGHFSVFNSGFPFWLSWSALPVSTILFCLTLAAVTRRVRDTGYHFGLSMIVCFWPALVPIALFSLARLTGSYVFVSPIEPVDFWILQAINISKYASFAMSLAAFYILSAPSASRLAPDEVTP